MAKEVGNHGHNHEGLDYSHGNDHNGADYSHSNYDKMNMTKINDAKGGQPSSYERPNKE